MKYYHTYLAFTRGIGMMLLRKKPFNKRDDALAFCWNHLAKTMKQEKGRAYRGEFTYIIREELSPQLNEPALGSYWRRKKVEDKRKQPLEELSIVVSIGAPGVSYKLTKAEQDKLKDQLEDAMK